MDWELVRMVWTIVKDILFQKLYTRHLPSSPRDLLLLNNNNLIGLNVIVTGATNGIGLHTARELAMAGAHVIMACRNTNAAIEIANKWKEEAQSSTRLLANVEGTHIYIFHRQRRTIEKVMELDLLSLSSVKRFAEEWMERSKPLHILINNAGIYKNGEPQKFSDIGIEQHIHVNHVAPALLTLLLLPSLLQAPFSRVINVNSVAHRCATVDLESWDNKVDERKFNGLKAYATSKLVNLMFLKTLASKFSDKITKATIQCIAVHPGGVNTNLAPSMKKFNLFWLFDAAQGARNTIYCATSEDVKGNLVNGFAYYSYNCKPDRLSSYADNADACSEVWQKTLKILCIDDNYINLLLSNYLI